MLGPSRGLATIVVAGNKSIGGAGAGAGKHSEDGSIVAHRHLRTGYGLERVLLGRSARSLGGEMGCKILDVFGLSVLEGF